MNEHPHAVNRRFGVATTLIVVWLAMLCVSPTAYAQDPAPSPSSAPGTPPPDQSVVGASTVTFRTFRDALQTRRSPMAAEAQAIYDRCTAAQIDCAFLLAVARKEAQYATDPAWIGNFNWGNMRCGTYARCFADANGNRWRQYTSFVEATDDWLQNLRDNYIAQRLTTVATIIPKYAPPPENDPPGYIRQVLQWMAEYRDDQATSPPPPTTSGWNSDTMFRAPLDGFTLDQVQALTVVLWRFNAGQLGTVLTLRRTGDQVTLTLGDVIGFAGQLLQPTATQLIALGFAIAAVGLLLLPLTGRPLPISLRAAPWLLVIVLGGFPSAGVAYLTIEGLRRNLSDTTYERLFAASETTLPNPPVPGTGAPLGEIQPLYPDAPGRRALDLAAAYLMVQRSDLEQDSTLPATFQQTFFTTPSDTMETWQRPQRAEVYATALRGFDRMLNGIVFVALAEVEEWILLICAVSLGLLGLALLITLACAICSPILRVVHALWTYWWQLFLGSLAISACQALLLALVYWRVRIDVPAQVLVWGGIALVIELILCAVLLLGVLLLFWQAATTSLRWRILAGGATLTHTLGMRAAQQWHHTRPARGVVRGALGGLAGGVLGGLAARRLGASRQAALAYAMSGSSLGRGAAAGALALGRLPVEMERGLRVGTGAARNKPLSLRGLLAARHAFAQRETVPSPGTSRAPTEPPAAERRRTPAAPPPHRSRSASARMPGTDSSNRSSPRTHGAWGRRRAGTARSAPRTASQQPHAAHLRRAARPRPAARTATDKTANDIELMAAQYERAGLHAQAQALRARKGGGS